MMGQIERCFGYLPETRFENLDLVIFLPKSGLDDLEIQNGVFHVNYMHRRGRLALAKNVEFRYK